MMFGKRSSDDRDNGRSLNEIITDMQTGIEQYKLVTLANVEHKDIILNGLQWLLAQQSSDGYWGDRNVTSTTLALIVLHSWANAGLPDFSYELVTVPCRNAEKWLREYLATEISYYPRIWTRSVVLYAIYLCGRWDTFCEDILNKLIRDSVQNTTAISADNAHHYARLIVLLDKLGRDHVKIEVAQKFCDFLLSMDRPDVYSMYFLNEIVQGYYCINEVSPNVTHKIEEIFHYLENHVRCAVVDSWSFVPYCSELIALATKEERSTQSLLQDTYFKIFREGGRRVDGSFYSDVQKTCWALLVLQRLREVHRISIPLHILREHFQCGIVNVESYRKNLGCALLKSFLACGVLAALVCFWIRIDLIEFLPRNFLAWIFGVAAVAVSSNSIIQVRSLGRLLIQKKYKRLN